MDTMAVCAHGDSAVSLGPLLTVHAGPILLELIHADARVVLLHSLGIAVTRGAQQRDLLALSLALPTSDTAHGPLGIIAIGVAAMAIGAGQSFLSVNILAERFYGDPQRLRQVGMAIETGIFCLPKGE